MGGRAELTDPMKEGSDASPSQSNAIRCNQVQSSAIKLTDPMKEGSDASPAPTALVRRLHSGPWLMPSESVHAAQQCVVLGDGVVLGERKKPQLPSHGRPTTPAG